MVKTQSALVIGGGSFAKTVISKAEEAIMNDFDRIPECFKTLTIDADYATQSDILLHREAAKNLLRNPSGYGPEIDQSEAKKFLRSLENSDKGGLLEIFRRQMLYLYNFVDSLSARVFCFLF